MGTIAPFLCKEMNIQLEIKRKNRKSIMKILLLLAATVMMAAVCLFVGSSHMTAKETLDALLFRGTPASERIVWVIRIPRVCAAIIAGAGLSVSVLSPPAAESHCTECSTGNQQWTGRS